MTWNADTSVSVSSAGVKITPTDVLYRYDTPLLFSTTMGVMEALCYKLDDHGDLNLFLLCPTSGKILEALKGGRISVRGALDAPFYWIVEARGDQAIRTWPVERGDLPSDFLPSPKLGLFAHFGDLPDTIEDEGAFFSVKFSGPNLRREALSFKIFKGLVDEVYAAVHKLFTPSILAAGRTSSFFDFEIAPPKFASLAITVTQPIIDSEGIRRRTKSVNLDLMNSIRSELMADRDEFFTKTAYMVDRVLEGQDFAAYIVEHHKFVNALANLIPGEGTGYDRVEFNANTRSGRKNIVIDGHTGKEIRAAYETNTTRRLTVRGVIIEINDDQKTFVIRTSGRRQITCALSSEIYQWLVERKAVTIGYSIGLEGLFSRRSRRDYIVVDQYPVLDQPTPQ